MARKVDIFVIGAQKAGTTALHAMLARHPAIAMSEPKELHHFDDESQDWSAPDEAALIAGFDWSLGDVLRGEATPIYCYWPQSLARLARYNPDARLVMLLREPAHRAFSHWRMETERGAEQLSFAEAISERGRARVRTGPDGAHRVHSYVERGFYAQQIERALRLFPREQMHFIRTDDLRVSPEATLAQLAGFLGVPVHAPTPGDDAVPLASPAAAAMDNDTRATLRATFADDIRTTGALTGLDLSRWLSPAYLEPIARAAT